MNKAYEEAWEGFDGRIWKMEVNTRDFIQKNYRPYDGDESFLQDATEATKKLWSDVMTLQKEERAKGGVLDMETKVVSTLTSYGAGYISDDPTLEKVVGLQTDKPLKRAFMPFGGIKMAEQACQTYGYTPDPELHKIFNEYVTTSGGQSPAPTRIVCNCGFRALYFSRNCNSVGTAESTVGWK